MATITRYVNPDSSGGDGTTSATSGANAAYASLSAWEAAEQNNLVTAGNIHELHCAGTSTADTTACTINGWTTGASNYIEIINDDDPLGVFPSSGYRMVVTAGTSLQNYEENVRLTKMAIHANGATYCALMRATGTVDYRVTKCVFKGAQGTAEHYGLSFISASGGTLKLWNCLSYNFGTNTNAACFNFGATSATAYVENCTTWDARKGYKQTAGTVVVKNCIYQSNGAASADGFFGTFDAASDYNLSNVAADAPGANSKNSTTVTFVDSANDDLHLASGDTGAKDAGTDLSAGSIGFSDDVDGETRSTWDMGFDEYVAGGAYTLTSASGSYSLTGTANGLIRASKLTAASGTYNLTGTAAATNYGRLLSASSGGFTLTGTDVTLTYAPSGAYSLTADSGQYLLTGTAAALLAGRNLVGAIGSYALTGTAAALNQGHLLTGASGSFSLSGAANSLKASRALTAATSSILLTGTSVTLNYSGATGWTVQSPTTTNWSVQATSSDVWTNQPSSTDSWTIQ